MKNLFFFLLVYANDDKAVSAMLEAELSAADFRS